MRQRSEKLCDNRLNTHTSALLWEKRVICPASLNYHYFWFGCKSHLLDLWLIFFMLGQVVHEPCFNVYHYVNLFNFFFNLVLIASQPFGNVCLWKYTIQWSWYRIENLLSVDFDLQTAPNVLYSTLTFQFQLLYLLSYFEITSWVWI